jgi:hypothetical protein
MDAALEATYSDPDDDTLVNRPDLENFFISLV